MSHARSACAAPNLLSSSPSKLTKSSHAVRPPVRDAVEVCCPAAEPHVEVHACQACIAAIGRCPKCLHAIKEEDVSRARELNEEVERKQVWCVRCVGAKRPGGYMMLSALADHRQTVSRLIGLAAFRRDRIDGR